MATHLDILRERMEAAAAALDFEEASRLRDQLSLLRGAPEPDAFAETDTSRLSRQVPGKMGLGTSEQTVKPPPGWRPPPRPDLMTKNKREAKRRRQK